MDALPAHFSETLDQWPDVIAISASGKARLIRSRDIAPCTQWILQARNGAGDWRAHWFFQSGPALRNYRADALRLPSREQSWLATALVDPVISDVVDELPDYCPQRHIPLVSDMKRQQAHTNLCKQKA